MRIFTNLAAAALMAATALAAHATELVMVDQTGCAYCERWEAEIGPAYPRTDEGRFAPLRRVDIDDIAEDVALARRVNFTPTFLVVQEGRELARLEGYPGQDFFWPLLTRLLTETTDYTGDKG